MKAKRGSNPNSLKNLKPFKPGPDPNRNTKGRPVGLPKLKELLEKVLGEEVGGTTAVELILKRQRMKALAGDQRATDGLLDRAYGKALQTVDNLVNGEPVRGFIIKTQDVPTDGEKENKK